MLTSCRGVITAPTGRSPRRSTPAIISLFARLQNACGFRFRNQAADLVFGDLVVGVAVLAEQSQQRLAGEIKQPDDRR